MQTLRAGDRGPLVMRLQHLLNSILMPSPRLRLDADFGRRTHDAVLRFQNLKRLVSDGVVGAQTWVALGQVKQTPAAQVAAPSTGEPEWIKIAKLELGVSEDSRPGYDNERIIEYHRTTTLKAQHDEVPWCSSFVNWVIEHAGRKGTKNAAAKSWLNWGSTLNVPTAGAVTVIRKKTLTPDISTGSWSGFHVAFLISKDAGHVRLLGGNQHNQVRYSNFSLAAYDVKGYRWPG